MIPFLTKTSATTCLPSLTIVADLIRIEAMLNELGII
jgi:hypothetical protein